MAPAAVRSNLLTYQFLAQNAGGLVFRNSRPGSGFVITFANLVNGSSNSSDAILLEGPIPNVAFHGGIVGTGSLDRFPLTCEVAVPPGYTITATTVAGVWHVTITGYYEPFAFST